MTLKKHISFWLATCCLLAGTLFIACVRLPDSTPIYVISTPTPSIISTPLLTQSATNDIYPLPKTCKKLDSSGLPVGSELQESNIIYLAGKDIDNLNQIWIVNIENGLRKMILDTSSYRFYAIGFLEDRYHFIMAGDKQFWLSDLAGTPPKLIELTSPELSSAILSNFPPYSRIGRGYNGVSPDKSPDGSKKAVWNLGDPNLVIIDNQTGQYVNVMQYAGRGVIEGNWSPDGMHYAFSYSKEHSKIYIVDVDGSNLHELASYESTSIGRPYWSLDGEKIVYTLYQHYQSPPTYYQILTIATGDTKTYGINAEESLAWRDGNDIVWSSDSRWILFYAGEYNTDQQYNIDIKALNISTGDFYCITDDNLIEIMAEWR